MPAFAAEIARRVLDGAAPAVIGLDPRPEALPTSLAPGESPPERILAFYSAVMSVLARHVPCVKPNIAFFERHGTEGYGVYRAVCELAHEHDLLVIGDVKRGDIGSTAQAYADGHFGPADAVTLHPYLGGDSIAPFLSACESEEDGRGVFVLVRTSNPGAKDFQDLMIDGRALCDHVASAVTGWGRDLPMAEGYSPVGAVVGATWPDELSRLRGLLPHAWLLIPGVGAQGGKVEDLAPAFDERGLGALVNQSRGVMQCFDPDDADWIEKIEDAVRSFAASCRSVAMGEAR